MKVKTIKEESLTALGDAIRAKTGNENLLEFPNEMVNAIGAIETGGAVEALDITTNGTYTAPEGIDGYNPITVNVPQDGSPPDEVFVISGNCNYRFAYNGWNWFIKNYRNKITTNNITNANCMFSNSTSLTEIPFVLNLNNASLTSLFDSCSKLETVPEISGKTNQNVNELFNGCLSIRQIPDSWGNLDLSQCHIDSYSDMSGIFNSCYSLRQIPAAFISKLHNDKTTSYFYKSYYSCFYYCYVLDEVINLPVDGATITSNALSGTFNACRRLKNITFATNEGIPYAANWKSQVLDLSINVGHGDGLYNILNYNSGITADKEVKDDATYQALKNDPDWFTCKYAYSRYNHDSAVATINSLPDTSAYLASAGGTNTIKFKGIAGSATDGGAINTLTEEEIAVATAKGWTVSLV